MRLSWKIYCVLAAFVFLAASQVEAGYHEQLWPFEMLSAVADERSVMAWHLIDGAGHVVLHHGDVDLPVKTVVELAERGAAFDPDQPQLYVRDMADMETWV